MEKKKNGKRRGRWFDIVSYDNTFYLIFYEIDFI